MALLPARRCDPFAWNGLIGFYLPVTFFVGWIGVMTYLLHTGIKRREREASEEPAIAGPLSPVG